MSSIFRARQTSFGALLAGTLLCGIAFRLAPLSSWTSDGVDALGYICLGFALFLTFVICNFTEADHRGRLNGFPMRCFTLPVSTRTLVAAPLLTGILAIVLIYAVWASWVLSPLGRELPVAWPGLYLATGMIGYLTTVWGLARFRVARLFTLGIGGTLFAVGWIVFREGDRALVGGWVAINDDRYIRQLLFSSLAGFGMLSALLAYFAIESQRRGGTQDWATLRQLRDRLRDAMPRNQRPFRSPDRAQLWREWQRHGMLLPLSTGGVLAIIMMPAPFLAPISKEGTGFVLAWMLATPLLLAFALGKGFGKADLWAKEERLSDFLGTRPLSPAAWIGAKMKAAAMAALSSWLLVVLLTTVWICRWGNLEPFFDFWSIAVRLYSSSQLYLLPAMVFLSLILSTWGLLIGSLFIGLSGRNWLLGAAACGVFVALFAPLFLAFAASQRTFSVGNLVRPWLPWGVAAWFSIKVAAAGAINFVSIRNGWVTHRAVYRYLGIWLLGTGWLVATAWWLIPVDGWLKWVGTLLVLHILPLLSVACAPVALAQNRRR